MILDGFLQFSAAQTIAVAAGTVISTNIIDLGLGVVGQQAQIPTFAQGGGARDIGIGDDPAMKVLVELVTAAASAGTTTMQVQILGAPDNGSGAPGTYTIMAQSDVIALVTATVVQPAGLQGTHLFDIDVPRPKPGTPIPRFLELNYVLTGTGTGGAVSSFLVLDRDHQIKSAAGFQSGYQP